MSPLPMSTLAPFSVRSPAEAFTVIVSAPLLLSITSAPAVNVTPGSAMNVHSFNPIQSPPVT